VASPKFWVDQKPSSLIIHSVFLLMRLVVGLQNQLCQSGVEILINLEKNYLPLAGILEAHLILRRLECIPVSIPER
jgi:hypothetical protein